jgi:hypothetical protein
VSTRRCFTRKLHVRLGIRLPALLLGSDLPPHNVLPDVVLLAQVEEALDLGRALGAETLGKDVVGEARNLSLALLDQHDAQHRDVRPDDATPHGLALALAGAARAVARVAVREQQLDTVRQEDTLLHRETLLVISTGDAEDVARPFGPKGVCGYFLRNFFVVEDSATRAVVKNWRERSKTARTSASHRQCR